MLMKQAEEKLEDNKICSSVSKLSISRGSKASDRSGKKNHGQKKRNKVKKVEAKIFFSFLVSATNYVNVPEVEEDI